MGQGQKNRSKILYGVVILVFFLVFFNLFLGWGEPEEKQTVQIVFFGDSSYGNIRDESAIPEQVGRLSGKTVFNAAFGGTSASRQDRGQRLDRSFDSLSLAALSKAICFEDYGVQNTIRPTQDITWYFVETVKKLQGIDFSGVETIIIGHGLNDYYSGVSLESDKDPMDEYTFAGALRSSLTALKQVNPSARIVLLTPTYNWLTAGRQTCEEFDGGGGFLEAYVEKEIQVAAEMDVEVIDLYHDFFPHESWEDWMLYTEDGLHPNEAGRAWIAEKIADYLEGEIE